MGIRKVCFVTTILAVTSGCIRNQSLEGLWGVSLQFSSHETQHTGLVLRADSSFFYFSRSAEDLPWHWQTGQWTFREGNILLASDGMFNLWLKPQNNGLELLDFEGKKVISDKAVRLQKVDGVPWNEKLNVILTGKLLEINGVYIFMPCNSPSLITLEEPNKDLKQLLDQTITARLSFTPQHIQSSPDIRFHLESVFGMAVCP